MYLRHLAQILKNRKTELKQQVMLTCFLTVLGQFPLRKIAPKPKTYPNPRRRGQFFLGAIVWIPFLPIVAAI